jgi:hypothetical protein
MCHVAIVHFQGGLEMEEDADETTDREIVGTKPR